ncbi:MAG: DUF1049 domain-containing protein [Spirochaetes bacterium]|nr:DUF1049 domain-containing protein [Spirochaetota bacterium]
MAVFRIVVSSVLLIVLAVLVVMNLESTTSVNLFGRQFESVSVVAIGLVCFVAGVVYSFIIYVGNYIAKSRRTKLSKREKTVKEKEKAEKADKKGRKALPAGGSEAAGAGAGKSGAGTAAEDAGRDSVASTGAGGAGDGGSSGGGGGLFGRFKKNKKKGGGGSSAGA